MRQVSFKVYMNGTGCNRTVRTVNLEENVLQCFEDNPRSSTRSDAMRWALVISLVEEFYNLHAEKLHPYHLQKVQSFLPEDYPARSQFSRWILDKVEETP